MDEVDPASPSGIPHPYAGWSTSIPKNARMITAPDMEELVVEYGEAARRIMEAGFDGVMIHGANGYLACELLSRVFNKRTDAYGGDLKGRAKYLLDMVGRNQAKNLSRFSGHPAADGFGPACPKSAGLTAGASKSAVELCKIDGSQRRDRGKYHQRFGGNARMVRAGLFYA